jgi:hypothetical protein
MGCLCSCIKGSNEKESRKDSRLVFPQPRNDVIEAEVDPTVDLDTVVEEFLNFTTDSPRIRSSTPSPLLETSSKFDSLATPNLTESPDA